MNTIKECRFQINLQFLNKNARTQPSQVFEEKESRLLYYPFLLQTGQVFQILNQSLHEELHTKKTHYKSHYHELQK